MSLSQIELVWVRVRMEWECFWVNLREDNKVSESKMAVSESSMAEFKMAAIIKLSHLNPRWQYLNSAWQNSWWLPSSSWVRMNEWSFLFAKWLNPWWQSSRWLPSSSWVRMNEWSFFVQMLGTNLGKCKWVWEEKLRWLNPTWQNSRWLPSSSCVRMNEFESELISLS